MQMKNRRISITGGRRLSDEPADLARTVKLFVTDVQDDPAPIKALELFGG